MSSSLIGLKQGQQLTMPMARDEESPDLLSGKELKAIDIRSHWKDLLPIIYSNENVQNIMEKSYQDFQEGFKLKDFKHRYALKGAWSFQDIHQGIYPYTLTTTDWIWEFEEKEWYAQANETDKEAKISIINALEKCTKIKGNIDILVTNSPGPPPGLMMELSESQIKKGVEANLMSIIWLCKKVLPKMKKRRYGRIINLSSTVAKEVEQGMGLSSFTRAGALAFCKTIAHENAQYGITVNSILTGGVLSDRTKDLLTKEAERSGISLEDMYANASQRIPAGYISTPEEFAQMVLFLCSERASYVTGISIPLDGGFMASI